MTAKRYTAMDEDGNDLIDVFASDDDAGSKALFTRLWEHADPDLLARWRAANKSVKVESGHEPEHTLKRWYIFVGDRDSWFSGKHVLLTLVRKDGAADDTPEANIDTDRKLAAYGNGEMAALDIAFGYTYMTEIGRPSFVQDQFKAGELYPCAAPPGFVGTEAQLTVTRRIDDGKAETASPNAL